MSPVPVEVLPRRFDPWSRPLGRERHGRARASGSSSSSTFERDRNMQIVRRARRQAALQVQVVPVEPAGPPRGVIAAAAATRARCTVVLEPIGDAAPSFTGRTATDPRAWVRVPGYVEGGHPEDPPRCRRRRGGSPGFTTPAIARSGTSRVSHAYDPTISQDGPPHGGVHTTFREHRAWVACAYQRSPRSDPALVTQPTISRRVLPGRIC
jgi:hypothetical protein